VSGATGAGRRNASRPRAQGLLDWHRSGVNRPPTFTNGIRHDADYDPQHPSAIEQAGLGPAPLAKRQFSSVSTGPPWVVTPGAVAVALIGAGSTPRAVPGMPQGDQVLPAVRRSACVCASEGSPCPSFERDARGIADRRAKPAAASARITRRCAATPRHGTEVDLRLPPTGTTSVSCPSRNPLKFSAPLSR